MPSAQQFFSGVDGNLMEAVSGEAASLAGHPDGWVFDFIPEVAEHYRNPRACRKLEI